MNASFTTLSHLVWIIILAVSAFFVYGSVGELIKYFKSKDGDGSAQIFIPMLLVSLVFLCSPLYLESAGCTYLVLSKEGKYLYTARPNMFGVVTQYDWNQHLKDGNTVFRVDKLLYGVSPIKTPVRINSTSNTLSAIQLTYAGRNSETNSIRRAELFATLKKRPASTEENLLDGLVRGIVENSPVFGRLEQVLDSYPGDKIDGSPSLSKKIDLLQELGPIDQEMRQIGLHIVDAAIDKK
jgi:hypothetical protein